MGLDGKGPPHRFLVLGYKGALFNHRKHKVLPVGIQKEPRGAHVMVTFLVVGLLWTEALIWGPSLTIQGQTPSSCEALTLRRMCSAFSNFLY